MNRSDAAERARRYAYYFLSDVRYEPPEVAAQMARNAAELFDLAAWIEKSGQPAP